MPLARQLRRGLTLIEILVVIVVLAVLATLVAPNVFRHVGSARETTARTQIEMLGAALDAYRLDNGRYPSTEQGLAALWQQPAGAAGVSASGTSTSGASNWRGPYLRKAVPNDPWGAPYQYRAPGTQSGGGYDLLSYGADGKAGGEGEDADVVSWK